MLNRSVRKKSVQIMLCTALLLFLFGTAPVAPFSLLGPEAQQPEGGICDNNQCGITQQTHMFGREELAYNARAYADSISKAQEYGEEVSVLEPVKHSLTSVEHLEGEALVDGEALVLDCILSYPHTQEALEQLAQRKWKKHGGEQYGAMTINWHLEAEEEGRWPAGLWGQSILRVE